MTSWGQTPADLLGVSRRAVAEWEAGSAYPKADRLKQLIALAVQQNEITLLHLQPVG